MNPLALAMTDVVVTYGGIVALKGISLEVPQGQIVALLGANGAGKTTALKAISGMVPVQSGAISLFGKDITNAKPEFITGSGVIQSPEGRQVFSDLTVEDNLAIGAFTVKDKAQIAQNYERVYQYFPVLPERRKQIAGTLSGGEQQMLAIGRALMGSPEVLLLDEPSLGLAPLIVQNIFRIIKEINDTGTTVLIVEQNALQTLKIADYAYVLAVGEVTIAGPGAELLNDKQLVEAYLGE